MLNLINFVKFGKISEKLKNGKQKKWKFHQMKLHFDV